MRPALLHARRVPGAAIAVALEAVVLDLDARAARAVRGEADLDLARAGRIGLGHPVGVDLPREPQPRGRLPGEHPPPVAAEAVRALLAAQPARAPVHPDRHERFLRP